MKGLWKTREGTVIGIGDMGTDHIQNCVRLLEKEARKGHQIMDEYWMYPEPDGDMAQLCYQQEMRHNEEILNSIESKLKEFKDELQRRGTL